MVRKTTGPSTRSIYLCLAVLSLALHLLLALFCLAVLQTACVFPSSSSSSSPRADTRDHDSAPPSWTSPPLRKPPASSQDGAGDQSKLEALFKHRLYNLPQPELQDDDWLLRVKTHDDAKDTGSEEEDGEDAVLSDSHW